MHRTKRHLYSLICIGFMGIILFETDLAANSAYEGIILCLKTVIPSLFPPILLGSIINHLLFGERIRSFSILGKICSLPSGCEQIMILGLISGYPVGAKMVSDAYQNQYISKSSAIRLLGFCSNAGPAFIFGILYTQFSSKSTLIIIWLIHTLSAILTGALLPATETAKCILPPKNAISLNSFLQNSIKTMSSICGWIVLFRIIIAFCFKYVLRIDSEVIQVIISGLLELSNGCIHLNRILQEHIRFIVACVLLSAGGLCVTLQTASVVNNLGLGWYLPGKTIQISISVLLSIIIHPFLFTDCMDVAPVVLSCIGSIFAIVSTLSVLHRKISSN